MGVSDPWVAAPSKMSCRAARPSARACQEQSGAGDDSQRSTALQAFTVRQLQALLSVHADRIMHHTVTLLELLLLGTYGLHGSAGCAAIFKLQHVLRNELQAFYQCQHCSALKTQPLPANLQQGKVEPILCSNHSCGLPPPIHGFLAYRFCVCDAHQCRDLLTQSPACVIQLDSLPCCLCTTCRRPSQLLLACAQQRGEQLPPHEGVDRQHHLQ